MGTTAIYTNFPHFTNTSSLNTLAHDMLPYVLVAVALVLSVG